MSSIIKGKKLRKGNGGGGEGWRNSYGGVGSSTFFLDF
jgi:hypothetical protein